MAEHGKQGGELAFSPDSRMLATWHYRDSSTNGSKPEPGVHVWLVKEDKLLAILDWEVHFAYDVECSGDGKYLACASSGGTCIWNMRGIRKRTILPNGIDLQFSTDEKSLLIRAARNLYTIELGTWKKQKRRLKVPGLFSFDATFLNKSQRIAVHTVFDMVSSANGKTLYTLKGDELSIWNVSNSQKSKAQ